MINDRDVAGLVQIILDVTGNIVAGLVRQRLFTHSEVEWFLYDLERSIQANVGSDLARQRISAAVISLAEVLNDDGLVMWSDE